jgi:hypothetical protein
MLLLSSSEAREQFPLSISDKTVAPAEPISFSVLSENEVKKVVCYLEDRVL